MQPCHSHFYEYKNEQQPDQTRTALPGLLTVLKVGPKRTTLFQGKLWIFVRYSEKRCEPLDWTAFDRINANTVIGVDNKSCHIQSFDKTKGQFNSMSNQGLHFEDVPINNDELVGKYLNTSHKDGVNYARIWYNGDEILPESTYTPQYMEKHKLGKYAKNQDAEKKSKKRVQDDADNDSDNDSDEWPRWITWPFKAVWWIVKKLLSLIGLSFLFALFNGNSDSE
jgi:hypothetical protein